MLELQNRRRSQANLQTDDVIMILKRAIGLSQLTFSKISRLHKFCNLIITHCFRNGFHMIARNAKEKVPRSQRLYGALERSLRQTSVVSCY